MGISVVLLFVQGQHMLSWSVPTPMGDETLPCSLWTSDADRGCLVSQEVDASADLSPPPSSYISSSVPGPYLQVL